MAVMLCGGGGALVGRGEYVPVTVSRRIGAPAGEIFEVLADPARHCDLDGSGMLRGVVSGAAIRGVGDVFVMRMYVDELGPDATVVTEIFDCSRVPEDQRADIDHGSIWVEGMRRTLERLDGLCTGRPGAAGAPG